MSFNGDTERLVARIAESGACGVLLCVLLDEIAAPSGRRDGKRDYRPLHRRLVTVKKQVAIGGPRYARRAWLWKQAPIDVRVTHPTYGAVEARRVHRLLVFLSIAGDHGCVGAALMRAIPVSRQTLARLAAGLRCVETRGRRYYYVARYDTPPYDQDVGGSHHDHEDHASNHHHHASA